MVQNASHWRFDRNSARPHLRTTDNDQPFDGLRNRDIASVRSAHVPSVSVRIVPNKLQHDDRILLTLVGVDCVDPYHASE